MTTRGPAELARIKLRYPLWTFWQDDNGLTAVRGSAIVRASTLGELDARLTGYENPLSAAATLAREFPDWQIDIRPAGMSICAAYWRSPDGRSRRYVVAHSTGELLARLRTIAPNGQPS